MMAQAGSTQAYGVTYEISLTLPKEAIGSLEIIRAVLVSCGFAYEEIVESVLLTGISLSFFVHDRRQCQAIQDRIKKLKLKKTQLSFRALRPKDWLAKWKEEFRPFEITERFKIVPAWEKASYLARDKEIIYIDSHLAFGTGMHPTTQFMARFIERCSGQFSSFFDIGTGTGILAILAHFYGAQDIYAIDHSRDCVECAKNNFFHNNINPPKIEEKDIMSFKGRKQYHFVSANLVSHDLMKIGHKLVRFLKSGGYLAVSGISFRNYKSVRQYFRQFPLRCLKIEREQRWTALLFKKIES